MSDSDDNRIQTLEGELRRAVEQRSFFESLLDASDILLAYFDRDFNFVWVNRAYALSCRKSSGELLGKNHFSLFPHPENEAIFAEVRRTGRPVSFRDKPFEFPDQPERGLTYWDWMLSPTRNRRDEVDGFVLSLRETTRVRQIEIALKQSEERFRLSLQNSPITVASLDADLRYTWVYNTRHGFTPEHVIGRRPDELLPLDHVADLMALYRRVRQSGVAERCEVSGRTGDVEWEYDATVEPQHNDRGEVIGLIVVLIDIAERRRAEREIGRLSRFPQENPNPVLRVNSKGILLYANPASRRLLDHWGIAAGSRMPAFWLDVVQDVLRSQKDRTEDCVCGDVVYSINVAWVSNADYVNLYGRDVTDRVRAEAELAGRSRELEAANTELAQFGSYLAHDLQAPLRAISGFAEVLKEDHAGDLGEAGRQYLDRIVAASRHAGGIISDLMRLVQLGVGDFYPEEIDLGKLAAEAFQSLRERETERECRLTVGPGLVARADRRMLTIAITNLLDNAVKYSSRREISDVGFDSVELDGRRVFRVCDNGVGFDMAYVDRLFEPFQRLHSPDDYPGTGLGLTIVRKIISRHGGRIWADSTDRGARFYFTLDA